MTDLELFNSIKVTKRLLDTFSKKASDLAESNDIAIAKKGLDELGFKMSRIKLLGGIDKVCEIAQKHAKPLSLFDIEQQIQNSKNNTI